MHENHSSTHSAHNDAFTRTEIEVDTMATVANRIGVWVQHKQLYTTIICKFVANVNTPQWLIYIARDGLGYGLRFEFQTQWLHCTMQNMFTLHKLGFRSLLPISV